MKIYVPQIRFLDAEETAKERVHETETMQGFKTRKEAIKFLMEAVPGAPIIQTYPDEDGGGFWFNDPEYGEGRACIREVEVAE